MTLWPFGGDPSIPYKYDLAQHINLQQSQFGKPILVLYFGDLDPKGRQIPESAFYRIKQWCSCDFQARRVGLNPGDEVRYSIPEQPNKPGAYQWEALDDDAAGARIDGAMETVFDLEALVENRADAEEAVTTVKRALRDLSL